VISHRFQVTSKQIGFMLIGSVLGIGMLSLPRTLAEKAHQDVGIAILLGAFVPLISLLLINRLLGQHAGKDLTIVSQQLFGKWLGTILLLLYITYIIIVIGITIRVFADITSLYLLRRTPVIAILIMINVSVFYICCHGAAVVGRIIELLFYLLFFNLVLLLFPLNDFEVTNLMPVGEAGWKNILAGAQVTAFAYAGVEGMLAGGFLMKRPHEFLPAVLMGLAFIVALYFLGALVTIGVYGHEAILKLVFPVLALFKSISISIFDRMEMFFLISWLGVGMRPAIILNMVGAHTLTRVVGLELNHFYPYMVGVVCLLSLLIGILPANVMEVFKLTNYLGMVFIVIALGYPLAYNLAGLIRNGRQK